MQPGLGWVPWWPSEVYPVDEHVAWFKDNVRKNASSVWLDYVLDGNDMVAQSIEHAHSNDMDFMFSFRLNDVHQKSDAFDDLKARIENVPKFYRDHPEYLVGNDPNQASYGQYVQNWQYEEVREFKLSLIEEIIENYDIDGFELDFLRSTVLFNTESTTETERNEIMLDVIKRVRNALDKKEGRYRYLSVRIPAHIYCHDAIGVEVGDFANAGVDIFNLSTYYCTEQVTSIGEIKKLAGNSLVFFEMTHASALGEDENGENSWRRTTPEQLDTTAYIAYKNGADGISLYNFQYYREQTGIDDPPYSEPPFDIISRFSNKDYLANANQHYYFALNHKDPKKPSWPLPKTVKQSENATWEFEMYSPEGGWMENGIFRIQSTNNISGMNFTVKVNGTLLSETTQKSEPYNNIYTQLIKGDDYIKAWNVPKDILSDGINIVELSLSNLEAQIEYIDLTIK